MIQNNKKIFLLIIALFFPLLAQPVSLIFDLGDVLFETNARKAFWHIGPTRFIYYAAALRNPLSCRANFYDFLHGIKALEATEVCARDEHGNALPELMCDWLKGTQDPHDILATIQMALTDQKNSYSSWSQYCMIKAIAELIFTPTHIISTKSLIVPGYEFARECKNNGHSLYILSNWDARSFELLKETFPHLFDLFDGIVISGQVGLLKPDPAIYQHLLTTYNLDPKDCIFIDDQLTNVQTAQKLGIHGIHHVKKKNLWQTSHNFVPVRQKLKELQKTKVAHAA